ncbi:SusC/RagA family TonB-linked outer membrane protein [Sediminibacterium soli]|uniref:SusC/RagA family TonB-linked outer membrane protein n=1 Tax=Sediminibacterium soli TaxID=2698829 RepID=UPI0013794A3D|nr:TonB-dependent receptor [Sediminibacterium soli]NCI47711.1 TonB-dependent receptor [Sediminibacterium soli]
MTRFACLWEGLPVPGIFSQSQKTVRTVFCAFILTLCFSGLKAQTTRVSGSVIDAETRQPVPGASVLVKGRQSATLTDAQGGFTLDAGTNDKLEVSSLGYATQTVSVSSGAIQVLLVATNRNLGEVVVIGYGTQKRADVTGAVVSVPKSRLSQLPVTNFLHAVEGSVPGVTITQTSSVPGSSANVLVRGQNTITAGSGPFIVVDGVPFSKTGGVTNDINPNDIASIEVLKDASATAIYGVNGANGVILITTKRGVTGKPVIRYNGYTGFDNFSHMLRPASPEAYVQKYADYKAQVPSASQTVLPNAYEIANYNAGKTIDWVKEATQQGVTQDHNLSISGGSKDVRYYVSGDYMKQQGIVKGYQYHRASIRTNLDINLTDYLTVGSSLSYTNNNYDGGRANFYLAAAMSPYGTEYDASGSYAIYPMYPELLYNNPLLGLYTDRTDRSNNLTTNVYAELKPSGFLKGLKYRLNAGYTYVTSLFGSYAGRNANNTLGGANVSSSDTRNWVLENILTWSKNWGLHHVDFTGVYSAQERNYFSFGATATGFINDQLSFNNLGAGATQTSGSYRDKYDLNSQMARVNYAYDSRYLFTVTARRDGSSVMGSGTDKFGVFPSVAFGWNVFNEKFMQKLTSVSNLKLRLSYGKSGNEAISVYQTITTDGTNRFPFSGVSTIGVLASNLGNANLHWENATTANLGIDFGFLNNRITGSIDLYRTETKDLLLRRNLPVITGYSNIVDNLGKTQNQGIELSLNTENIITRNFKWTSGIVFASNKNRIVDLYGDKKDDLGNRWFIGKPIGVIYDYSLQGVWQTGEDASKQDPGAKPGDLKFADINNSGSITADDKMILGQTAPKWTGGITNTFQYKNFNLSVFIQTVQGAMKNNVTLTYADEAGRMNLPAETGYWTPTNKSNTRPSLSYTNTRGYGYPSDNSYTRIKDVTLSYVFPQRTLDKLRLGSLTVYASGRNLYTFTNWIGWDPENNYSFRGSGDWTNNYPLTRSIVFGLNVTLR